MDREPIWWLCPKAISRLSTAIQQRARRNNCSFCANKKVHTNSIAHLFPEVAAEWDYAANKPLKSRSIWPRRFSRDPAERCGGFAQNTATTTKSKFINVLVLGEAVSVVSADLLVSPALLAMCLFPVPTNQTDLR